MDQAKDKPILKAGEVAEILRCTPQTVRKLIASGRLPCVSLTDSIRGDRIRRDDLERFLNEAADENRRGYEQCLSISATENGGSNSRTKAARSDGQLKRKLAEIAELDAKRSNSKQH